MRTLVSTVSLSLVCFFTACGGSTSEPEVPAEDTAPAETSAKKAEAPKEAEPEPEPPPPEPATPRDILIREGTAFMLDHKTSDPGLKAEEDCKKKSKDDVAKQANCVAAALGKMDNEGFEFDEDDEGNWWYVRFAIVKSVKVEYNKVQVEIGEAQGRSLTLKPTGKDVAKRKKGTVPKELNFEVPDEYTVVLHDPSRGKLYFQPKLGLFDKQE